MKKLMCAVAAVAAGVAMAEGIQSANIVGYMNTDIAKDAQQFLAAPFVTIGQVDADGDPCVRLSDLTVTGYGEDGLDMGGCWGEVWIDMLHTNGSVLKNKDGMEMSYLWYDEDGEYEAGWYDGDEHPLKDDQSVLGNADEITFKVGEGICFNTRNDYAGCKLKTAGQVVQEKVYFVLSKDAQQIAGNPLARAVKLSELSVTGYGEDGLDMGGCWGDVWIDMLHINGSVLKKNGLDMSYLWYDEDGEYEAGWYDGDEHPMQDDQSVLGNADEIEFAAGEGICVNTRNDYAGCTLIFPSLKGE